MYTHLETRLEAWGRARAAEAAEDIEDVGDSLSFEFEFAFEPALAPVSGVHVLVSSSFSTI